MTPGPLILGLLRLELGKADCSRRKVAAVITNGDGWIVGKGHNELPEGSCINGDCPRGQLSYAVQPKDVGYEASGCFSHHAEHNALKEAGATAKGGTIFVTEKPCPGCQERLDQAGVSTIVWVDPAVVM